MKKTVKTYLNRLRKDRRRQRKMLAVLVCLSLFVAGATSWALHINGESLTGKLYCGYSEEHQHDETCMGEKMLICGQDEGTLKEDGESSNETAGGHIHTDECYEFRYQCGLEEHQHKLSCYSNPNAATETKEIWEKTVSSVTLTGDFAEDLIAVASTQLGYVESKDNYQVVLDEDGNETSEIKGYTRYGAWYGDLYGDWCAMFVSFCLHYAGITDEMVPYADNCPKWVEILTEKNFYKSNGIKNGDENSYLPERGDLIFFDRDGEGEADHVGIVEELEVRDKSSKDDKSSYEYIIHTLEGDSSNQVAQREYALEDDHILGYGSLFSAYVNAVDHNLIENVRHLTARTEDGAVVSAIGEIPEQAELTATPLTNEQMAYVKEKFGLTGHFYDIKIMLEGQEYQPEKTVRMSVSGLGYDAKDPLTGYHLADVSADSLMDTDAADVKVEQVDVDNTGNRVSFGADGFSIYGVSTAALADETSTAAAGEESVTETPARAAAEGSVIETYQIFKQLEEIDVTALGGKTFAITSYKGKYAMTATAASGGGLKGGTQNSITADDVIWTFEAVNAGSGQYRIKSNTGSYLRINNGSLSLASGSNNATTFTATNPSGDASHILLNGSNTYLNAFGGEDNFSKFSVYNGTDDGSKFRLYSLEEVQFGEVTDTVSPSSSIINLFDYWLVDPDTSDYQDGNTNINSGIDKDHSLKFCLGNIGGINSWTRSAAPYQDMVENQLTKGYPVLKSGLPYNTSGQGSTGESLAYLFDPTIAHEGKASYAGVKNLLSVDKDGYYYYNSRERYAYYNQESNSFTEYSNPAVNGNSGYGQFFPFNELSQAFGKHSTSEGMNHYFGVSLTARFIQDHEGYTDSTRERETTFEFSGDDDVWIFIDDVLVADLGGIHDAASVKIDFATGEVTINDGISKTLKSLFEEAGQSWTNGESHTFADNSTHTLKFFYLERGNVDSNMMLKYNLTEIPATSIFKVDQYGDQVSGATFAFYPAYVEGNADSGTWYYATEVGASSGLVSAKELNASAITYDENWNITYNNSQIPALYYGGTDSNGSMIFVDPDGMPLSLEEIKNLLGDHFIMREVKVPEGYRTVCDEAFLYVANDTTLMCSDPYGTGVWVSPNVKITATNTLHVAETSNTLAGSLSSSSEWLSGDSTNGYTINYYTPDQGSHGTLFAVVLKRNGIAPGANNFNDLNIPDWYPLYGSDEKGYIVSSENNLTASISAAKEQAKISSNVFTEQASGMQLTYTDLPGDPTRYYSYRLANNLSVTGIDPQYLVAYYWTTADSLDGANDSNTLRISSHDETTPAGASGFDNLWGATIEVPNVINALYFQKADTDGDLVNDAGFALYEVKTNTAGKGFYQGTSGNSTVYIRLDEENGTAKNGAATVYASMDDTSGSIGTYTIQSGTSQDSGYITDEGAGTIMVTADGATYTISPATNARGQRLVGLTHDTCSYVSNEEGTGHFHYLKTGSYFLKEIMSPAGYSMNYANIPVKVTAESVYANAGTTEDNVRVGNGVGYLVKTLDVFASLNNIDETLSWVYTHLKVKSTANEFENDLDNMFLTHGYLTDNYGFDGYGISSGANTSYIPSGALTNGTGEGSLTSGTDTADAMTQYLRYEGDLSETTDENKIFDYALYQRRSGSAAGVQSYRLWTESGWSDLAVFQDSDYGQSETTTGRITNYTVLTGEISNLFSSSTFVQVTDEVDIDLTVTKVTNDFEDSSGQTATVYLDGAAFYLTNSSNQYYRYDETTDTTTWVAEKDDATKLTTKTYFKNGANAEYAEVTTSVRVENGQYTKIYTINGNEYFLSTYDNGTATFRRVSGLGQLTGTLRRSYFKVYNLTEGTYTLTEETAPTYDYTVGGATSTESFNDIGPITIEVKSGNYYYYESSATGNLIIVSNQDITFETQTDGTQVPKSFTYRDVDGNPYKIPLTPAADGTYTYSVDTGNGVITGTLYQTTGNGFTLEVNGEAATRVFRVDSTGTTAPYYDETDAYQAGFRVLNTSEPSDQSVTLVKLDSSAIGDSTQTVAGYDEAKTTFTVSDSENSFSTHRILTGAKFYLYYKTSEEGVETPYYYGYAENGTTVQWSTELTDAQKFSVDELASLTFSSLNASNTYYLVECEAPDGYNLPTGEMKISWGDDGKLKVIGEGITTQTVTETTSTGGSTTTEEKTYILVYNTGGYRLPQTGGAGTSLFTLAGLAILAVLPVYGLAIRHKRERRVE